MDHQVSNMNFDQQIDTDLAYALALANAALESTADGVLIVNRDGKIARWNQRFVELWRVPKHLLDNTAKEPLLQYVTDQMADPDAFLSKVLDLYANPEDSSFDMLYLKDGRIVERYSQPLMIEGEITGRFWSFRDVTEREKAEEALLKSENQYRAVFKTSTDPIAINSLDDGTYYDVNQAFLDLLGYERDEIIGRTSLELNIWADPKVRHKLIDELRQNKHANNFDTYFRKKNGDLIWGLMSSCVIELDGVLCNLSITKDITERKQAQYQMELLEHAINLSNDAVYLLNDQLHFVYINDTACESLGYNRDELMTMRLDDIDKDFEYKEGVDLMRSAPVGIVTLIERRHQTRDRHTFPVEVSLTHFEHLGNKFALAVARNISERKESDEALRDSEARYRALFEDTGEGIFLMRDNRFVDCNPATLRIFGCSRDEIIGATPIQYSPRLQPDGRLSANKAQKKIARAMSGKTQFFEWQHLRQDGTPFDAEVILNAVRIGGETHLLATVRDISERKQSAEKIEHLAFYDQLTEIPNRSFFMNRLEQEISECRATGNLAAILLVDVLNFTLINNSLGHRNGDELLKQIAHRLLQCEGETGTVARLSGDIFAFLLPNLGDTQDKARAYVEFASQKIFKQFEQTFTVSGVVQHCDVAIGSTVFGTDAETPEELLSEVELALHEGKREKDGVVKFYDPALQSLTSKRAQMEESLRQALEQGEFELYYQPQQSMGRLVGVEALIRWRHPEKGMISPGEFIPVAEETGLIIPIGDWVVKEACEQLQRWEAHSVLSGVTVAVNISAAQMSLQNFVERALNIITQKKTLPHKLKFELTESALARDSDSVVEKMHTLRAAGIQFALDDFGTGYSSLSYLKRLPIEQIKIDQSFVRDLLVDVNDATIAKTIINLARDFGMNVIAEGVETEAQQAFLENLGCHTYQGYLYARPMPAKELEEYSIKFA